MHSSMHRSWRLVLCFQGDEVMGIVNREKNVLILVVVGVLLCLCTACAENPPVTDNEIEEMQADILFDPQTVEDAQSTDNEIEETQEDILSDSQMEDGARNHLSIERMQRDSSVSLDFYTKDQSTKIGEDTLLWTRKCIYPVVRIEENESAASKINADIQERVDSFHKDSFVPDCADEDYHSICDASDSDDIHFYGYFDEMIFTVTRADSKVVSFLVTTQYYIGGAHGMDYYTGLNYDTQTGELLRFDDLAGNAGAFRQDTLAFIHNLASATAYQSIMWENDIDELQEVLYQDERWYLSTSGLVLFSNPYELGAFFAGKIEFTIPYSDLEEMGVHEQYEYTGTRTILLQTEAVCFMDLNGDGQEEEIQFYIDAKGSANTDVHFLVDGTDYAAEHETLSRQFSDDDYIFCWTACFLYDMDPTDTTTEIAFQMNYSSWTDDIVVPYTFLYRYEGSGALSYLGRIEGTITDPTAVYYISPQDSNANEK